MKESVEMSATIVMVERQAEEIAAEVMKTLPLETVGDVMFVVALAILVAAVMQKIDEVVESEMVAGGSVAIVEAADEVGYF